MVEIESHFGGSVELDINISSVVDLFEGVPNIRQIGCNIESLQDRERNIIHLEGEEAQFEVLVVNANSHDIPHHYLLISHIKSKLELVIPKPS